MKSSYRQGQIRGGPIHVPSAINCGRLALPSITMVEVVASIWHDHFHADDLDLSMRAAGTSPMCRVLQCRSSFGTALQKISWANVFVIHVEGPLKGRVQTWNFSPSCTIPLSHTFPPRAAPNTSLAYVPTCWRIELDAILVTIVHVQWGVCLSVYCARKNPCRLVRNCLPSQIADQWRLGVDCKRLDYLIWSMVSSC